LSVAKHFSLTDNKGSKGSKGSKGNKGNKGYKGCESRTPNPQKTESRDTPAPKPE